MRLFGREMLQEKCQDEGWSVTPIDGGFEIDFHDGGEIAQLSTEEVSSIFQQQAEAAYHFYFPNSLNED